jgi:hypothetical protein
MEAEIGKGKVYVVHNDCIRNTKGGMPYKVGITQDTVGNRYYGLGLMMPGTFVCDFAYEFSKGYKDVETDLHNILDPLREKGEWFNITGTSLTGIKSICEKAGGVLVTDTVAKDIIDTQRLKELSLNPGAAGVDMDKCYVGREGNDLVIYKDTGYIYGRINIPLFYAIARYTVERRTYKDVLTEFYDGLTNERVISITLPALKNAGTACGKLGGRVAFLLGIFCRYYDKLPRSVNFVGGNCEKCKNEDTSTCGKKSACGEYYGCGDGVTCPMGKEFKVGDIPEIRAKIKSEAFPDPLAGE